MTITRILVPTDFSAPSAAALAHARAAAVDPSRNIVLEASDSPVGVSSDGWVRDRPAMSPDHVVRGGRIDEVAHRFRLDQIDRILGMSIPNQEVERILRALGFETIIADAHAAPVIATFTRTRLSSASPATGRAHSLAEARAFSKPAMRCKCSSRRF